MRKSEIRQKHFCSLSFSNSFHEASKEMDVGYIVKSGVSGTISVCLQ